MVSIAGPVKLDRVTEPEPGRFRTGMSLGRMVDEFAPKADARFLLLLGLKTDQEFKSFVAMAKVAGARRGISAVSPRHAPTRMRLLTYRP
jgi:hypothetical protein